jgi:hypothetical protein
LKSRKALPKKENASANQRKGGDGLDKKEKREIIPRFIRGC